MTAVKIGAVAAEGSDLTRLLPPQNRNRPVGDAARNHGVLRKKRQKLLRKGTGAKIKIRRLDPAQKVAHAAAYGITQKACALNFGNQIRNVFGQAHAAPPPFFCIYYTMRLQKSKMNQQRHSLH